MSLLYGYDYSKKSASYISKIKSAHPDWFLITGSPKGWMYLAATPGLEYCKVGFSQDPGSRIKGINYGLPNEVSRFGKLTCLCIWPSFLIEERRFHSVFSEFAFSKKRMPRKLSHDQRKLLGQDGATEIYKVEGVIADFVYAKRPDLKPSDDGQMCLDLAA